MRSQAAAARCSGDLEVAAAALTLTSLPDDAFLLVIAACTSWEGVPLFEAVKGLACLSKGMRQQLYRLQPLVGVHSLTVMLRPAHGPWRVTLLYEGALTKTVLEQAQQGRVRWIDLLCTRVAPAMARRVVPELLGAGCSLLELTVQSVDLNGTWASIFGEAAVCSSVLRMLSLESCRLLGPLPELRLPALQVLQLSFNSLSGGLEPLRGCTALQVLEISQNNLTGSLEPLRGCTALQLLDLAYNQVSGGLEPLRGCTALQDLHLGSNQLTGGVEWLRGCTALQTLDLFENNQLTGGLEPLRGCTLLRMLSLGNTLVPSEEDKAHFKEQCGWEEYVEEESDSGGSYGLAFALYHSI